VSIRHRHQHPVNRRRVGRVGDHVASMSSGDSSDSITHNWTTYWVPLTVPRAPGI